MQSIDRLLRECDSGAKYPKQTWIDASEHLLAKLEEFLACPLRYDLPLEQYVNDGLLIDVKTDIAQFNRLGVFLRGIVATIDRDGTQGVAAGATLFVYCCGRKVNSVAGESFIDLEYLTDSSGGEWRIVGWFKDHYGEHEEFDEL